MHIEVSYKVQPNQEESLGENWHILTLTGRRCFTKKLRDWSSVTYDERCACIGVDRAKPYTNYTF